ncbi:metal-dependent protein hydrolase, partial [Medicago truncatula]
VLEGLDAVLDVGGVYDPSRDRYDHHQKGFEEVFGHGFSTKLSSAGLVYKHFGKEIIANELKVDEEHQNVHYIYLAVYRSFMEYLAWSKKFCAFKTESLAWYIDITILDIMKTK